MSHFLLNGTIYEEVAHSHAFEIKKDFKVECLSCENNTLPHTQMLLSSNNEKQALINIHSCESCDKNYCYILFERETPKSGYLFKIDNNEITELDKRTAVNNKGNQFNSVDILYH